MNAKKTPLQQVNEEHGGKAKLVEKILGVLEGKAEEASDLKNRLLAASNQKLLRLLKVSETVKAKFGSRQKLVETVAGLLNRAKDSDYVKRLEAYTPAKLLDLAQSLARRGKKKAAPAAKK